MNLFKLKGYTLFETIFVLLLTTILFALALNIINKFILAENYIIENQKKNQQISSFLKQVEKNTYFSDSILEINEDELVFFTQYPFIIKNIDNNRLLIVSNNILFDTLKETRITEIKKDHRNKVTKFDLEFNLNPKGTFSKKYHKKYIF